VTKHFVLQSIWQRARVVNGLFWKEIFSRMAEQKQLNQQENALSGQIFAEKHPGAQ
jgi:hypothetical protein